MVNAGVPTGKTFATNIDPHPRAPDADTIMQLKTTDAKAIYRPLPSFEWVYTAEPPCWHATLHHGVGPSLVARDVLHAAVEPHHSGADMFAVKRALL